MVAPLSHRPPAHVAGGSRQARVLELLTPLEIRILAAHLYDRASFDAIATEERLTEHDARAIYYFAIVQLHAAGYDVRPPGRTRHVDYVPNDWIDHRGTAASAR